MGQTEAHTCLYRPRSAELPGISLLSPQRSYQASRWPSQALRRDAGHGTRSQTASPPPPPAAPAHQPAPGLETFPQRAPPAPRPAAPAHQPALAHRNVAQRRVDLPGRAPWTPICRLLLCTARTWLVIICYRAHDRCERVPAQKRNVPVYSVTSFLCCNEDGRDVRQERDKQARGKRAIGGWRLETAG